MANWVHKESELEYTTGNLAFTVVLLLIMGVIVGGAGAAIPAFLGFIGVAIGAWIATTAMWVLGLIVGVRKFLNESTKVKS